MDQDKIKKYAEILRELDSEIREYLDKSEDSAAAVAPDKSLGRLSRMEAMQDQQMVLELRRRKKDSYLKWVMLLKELKRVISVSVYFAAKKFHMSD